MCICLYVCVYKCVSIRSANKFFPFGSLLFSFLSSLVSVNSHAHFTRELVLMGGVTELDCIFYGGRSEGTAAVYEDDITVGI